MSTMEYKAGWAAPAALWYLPGGEPYEDGPVTEVPGYTELFPYLRYTASMLADGSAWARCETCGGAWPIPPYTYGNELKRAHPPQQCFRAVRAMLSRDKGFRGFLHRIEHSGTDKVGISTGVLHSGITRFSAWYWFYGCRFWNEYQCRLPNDQRVWPAYVNKGVWNLNTGKWIPTMSRIKAIEGAMRKLLFSTPQMRDMWQPDGTQTP